MQKKSVYFLVFMMLILSVDFITKQWALEYLQNTQNISLIGDWLQLSFVRNDGVAFGLDLPYLSFVTIVLIVILAWMYVQSWKEHHALWYHVGFGMLFGGALGNAFERIFVGEVIDFVSVSGFSVFNVADIGITFGVVCILLDVYICRK